MEKIELINLTLYEIQKASTMIDGVLNDTVRHLQKEDNDILKTRADYMEKVLEEARLSLREVLEKLGNCQNDTDMVCPVDVALSEVPFDLIYERKDEYDFEEELITKNK